MKTYSPKPGDVDQKWWVIDLEGQTVGRAATQVATLLRGKHKPEFVPHMDIGDFVVVVNAEKVVLTGNKLQNKKYYHHTGYPGGIKGITAAKLLEKKPEKVFKSAVRGMLPKSPLGRKLLKKLKIYTGPEHPHAAQVPESYAL